MDPKQLDYFRELLTNWLDDLLRYADQTVITIMTPEFLPDPLDRASFDSERSFQLRIRDRESILIKKIKNSLMDIENGTYGICQNCGEEISFKRLEARPVAEHCIHCKTEMEKKERIAGT
jgi:DnaK suppressor protein